MTTFHYTEKQPQMDTDKHGLDLTSKKIIGCAFEVFNVLGSGFLEKVYKNTLLIELRNARLQVEKKKNIQKNYKGQVVGNYFADLLVDQAIIVEIKAVQSRN